MSQHHDTSCNRPPQSRQNESSTVYPICARTGVANLSSCRRRPKTNCINQRCDRDVGHQVATFCYTGVAVQIRLAMTSINSRTGCCLYRLPHQCSAWCGKSVIMQRSTQKPFVPSKDVIVTLGSRWQRFVTLALRRRSGWQ